MAVVVVLATLAYMHAGWSFADASYMVALTIYTVGYGEVRPINTTYLHTVTMGTMVLGCTGMILLTSARPGVHRPAIARPVWSRPHATPHR